MAHIDADTSRSLDQPIKRAQVVYGKRTSHVSLQSPVAPAEDQQQFSERGRVHDTSIFPSQRRKIFSSSSVHVSDSEIARSPDASSSFQFGFRHQLKELDEEFDCRDVQSSKLDPSPFREYVCGGPCQVKVLESVSTGTAVLSTEARPCTGDLLSASLPPSPASRQATSSSQEHPHESPPVRRRTRRVVLTSDSEVGAQSNSSAVSPVRHAITTPRSRSSATPPTSGEIFMTGRKSKGKAPARDVLPLVFDVEQPLTAELPIKSKRGKRSEPLARHKTKAPTKKERREAALESSRIAATRPVEVIHAQEHKRTLSSFLAIIHQDSIVTPTSGAGLLSDPIEKFSSPTDNSKRASPLNSMLGVPTGLLGTSAHVGTNDHLAFYQRAKSLPPAAGDSDDEMPSVASIIHASGKQPKLQATKQFALKHADTREAFEVNSDDDDLLIVKDDMHAVAREEAAQRRLDKAHGSPVKDLATLRRINHPSVRPAVVSPPKFSRQELQELAKPSFARKGKGSKGQLTKKQLDQLMITQHNEEQLKSIKRHEAEWIKGGGRLSRDTGGDDQQTSLSKKLGTYAELGLRAVEAGSRVEEEASTDESDEDYALELRGSASPEPMDAVEGDGELGDSMEISQVLQPEVDDEEGEVVAPLRRNKSGQRHTRVVVGSDDEGQLPVHRTSGQRDSTSSMESQTEDENDKENSAKLMYDRSEDKENKAVVRHELSPSELAFVPGRSLHGIKDGITRSLSLASAEDLNDTSSLKGDVRSPLKDISKDEDDLFLLSPPANSPFTRGLLHTTAVSPPQLSTSSLGSPPVLRSERIGRINRLSLNAENIEIDPSKRQQPSFLERLRNQVNPEPSLAAINPVSNGGFSQLFSAEDQSSTKPDVVAARDDLSLTLDVGLKPALEVNDTVRQKAETIFEREQEYVVAAAVQNDRPKELLYVNDHGFLTQTRPECSSPEVYRMTPSQASKFVGTQIHFTQTQSLGTRPPLRTLSLSVTQELSPEHEQLRRLHRRSPSPLEHKSLGHSNLANKLNAFEILGKVPKPPSKVKLGKSEFVAAEAEESDEDDMFGFGDPKGDDEEEEDDNDQDKIVEGLVDDAAMDAETEGAELVLEKHREHVEEDDQRLQKLHEDAIEGKFRMKRRGREFGLEDDSDEDDDEDARRIRQRIHKKRKIEGDSLEALGRNEETRAFYNTYHQDLIDEDDEFGHLREDTVMPVGDDTQVAEAEEKETVSVDEIRQHVRAMAQNKLEVEVMDPEDTSWIDQSMINEAEDVVRVKVVDYRRSKATGTVHHPSVGQIDFDVEQPKRHAENDRERNQLASWAKNQSNYHGTGRSGNSAAVTGHTKVKSGGGSLRPKHPSNAASVTEARRVKKNSSLLSTVSSRSGKFTV